MVCGIIIWRQNRSYATSLIISYRIISEKYLSKDYYTLVLVISVLIIVNLGLSKIKNKYLYIITFSILLYNSCLAYFFINPKYDKYLENKKIHDTKIFNDFNKLKENKINVNEIHAVYSDYKILIKNKKIINEILFALKTSYTLSENQEYAHTRYDDYIDLCFLFDNNSKFTFTYGFGMLNADCSAHKKNICNSIILMDNPYIDIFEK